MLKMAKSLSQRRSNIGKFEGVVFFFICLWLALIYKNSPLLGRDWVAAAES